MADRFCKRCRTTVIICVDDCPGCGAALDRPRTEQVPAYHLGLVAADKVREEIDEEGIHDNE